MKILLINMGGTSTKLAVVSDGAFLDETTLRHDPAQLRAAGTLWDQQALRAESVRGYLAEQAVDVASLDAIVSRGAPVKPLRSGVYRVDEEMLADAKSGRYGTHPCAIGCRVALDLADGRLPVLTVDPPCIDEMIPLARYTGLPQIRRRSSLQALNHKAVGREVAAQLGKAYEEVRLVIVHLGSGISVASHCLGQVIDVTNGLDGDAPFGLDRPGTLPAGDWMRMIQSGDYSKEQLARMLNGSGGAMAHLGTNLALDIEARIQNGDEHAREVYEAMAFQTSKAMGTAACAMGERPDALVLTGGLANSVYFTNLIRARVAWMAPLHIVAGEREMQTLAERALQALRGELPILRYNQVHVDQSLAR